MRQCWMPWLPASHRGKPSWIHAELPDDVVTKVPDHFSNEELADAVLSLMADTGACARFAERGVDYIASIHDPEICAQKYHEWIEASYERAAGQFLPPAVSRTSQLLQRLPSRERQSMRSSAAKAMAFIQKQFASPARLLCDITQMQAHDYGTGVHRVVRNVTNCYLKNPWEGLTTELVCSMPDDADGDRLCYAHGYVGRHLVPQTLEWQDRAIILIRGMFTWVLTSRFARRSLPCGTDSCGMSRQVISASTTRFPSSIQSGSTNRCVSTFIAGFPVSSAMETVWFAYPERRRTASIPGLVNAAQASPPATLEDRLFSSWE